MAIEQLKSHTKHFDVFSITEGVYAAIAVPGTGAMSNAGFIDLGESVLVFDSFNTQQAAAELSTLIAEYIGKPISHVINSHWHGDHIRGNQSFQNATIVATERTQQLMHEIHPERISRQRTGLADLHAYIEGLEQQMAVAHGDRATQLRQEISLLKEIEISLPELELTLPSETFESAWFIKGKTRAAQCHTLGGGHTASDAFLYIPSSKVCYIGDLIAVQNHMLVVDGDVQAWVSILDKLKHWDIDYVVPGHGPIGDKAWIGRAVEYLTHLLESSTHLRNEGNTEEQLNTLQMPSAYADWAAPELYLKNIRHLAAL